MGNDQHPFQALEFSIDPENDGKRLDLYLAEQSTGFSRSGISRDIQAGAIKVNGQPVKPSYRVSAGDEISGQFSTQSSGGPHPENIPIDILHEDAFLIVVNKPAQMVVHPSKGHGSGTLASALSYHFQQLSTVAGPSRPGIVHRLDRDTTGVMVVAKDDRTHDLLARQFADRSIAKEYIAIVHGRPDHDRDVINQPIGPHPNQRAKMAIRKTGPDSRRAETFYEVHTAYERFSTLRLLPRTGRTHQIRVHLAHIQCPVLCDRLYSGASVATAADLTGDRDARLSATPVIQRQALHALSLTLAHPENGDQMKFTAPLPEDMAAAIECLQHGIATN